MATAFSFWQYSMAVSGVFGPHMEEDGSQISIVHHQDAQGIYYIYIIHAAVYIFVSLSLFPPFYTHQLCRIFPFVIFYPFRYDWRYILCEKG
jgi:hypothetical protein